MGISKDRRIIIVPWNVGGQLAAWPHKCEIIDIEALGVCWRQLKGHHHMGMHMAHIKQSCITKTLLFISELIAKF